MGFAGHDAEACGAKEVLGNRAPEIPDGLDGGVLLFFDEGLGVDAQGLTEYELQQMQFEQQELDKEFN